MERVKLKKEVRLCSDCPPKGYHTDETRCRECPRLRPLKGEIPDMTPDYAARKVIVAAFCYYVMDEPIMSDARYDRLSDYVADHWDELSPDRRWALRDPKSVRAGGSHIWFSLLAACAALNHVKYKTGKRYQIDEKSVHKTRKGLTYVTCSCQTYEVKL